jgi:curved DNA-binding protein CbpA
MYLPKNYYQILGIPSNASAAVIKAAYKNLAKQFHPDINPDNSQAEEQFKLINEAYQTLSKPAKKASYDQQLFVQHLVPEAPTFQYQTSYTTNYHRNFEFGRYQPKNEQTKTRSSINPQEGNLKFYILSFFFLVIIGALGLILGHFMNQYAAKEHLEEGNKYLQNKQYEQADGEFDAAIEFNEALSDAYFGKGLIMLDHSKNHKKAILYFSAAINISDTVQASYFEKRAYSFYALEAYQNALNDINIALKFPKIQTGENYYFRGMCKTKLGLEKSACPDFQSALKLNFQHAEEKILQYCY